MTVTMLCAYCKHLNPNQKRGDRATCAAFPTGIPREVITGDVHHVFPMAGDHGIVFEVEKPENKKWTQELVNAVLEERKQAGLE